MRRDYAEAMVRYGSPPSQFMEIDGTKIHYRDEGEGQPLVLLHGSRGNLQQWDGWVAALGAEFRIIRLDALGHGLSGPDGRDDYSAERGAGSRLRYRRERDSANLDPMGRLGPGAAGRAVL